MPRPSRNPAHVIQSHNPDRKLRSHVVQARNKAQSARNMRLPFYNKTKAEMEDDLRRAVEATRGPHAE
jgi:hypothetical protein